MKQSHSLRRWTAAAAAVALSLAPVLVLEVNGQVAGASGSSDAVEYVQTSTSSNYTFVPGNGTTPTTQSITPSGTCKTPTTSSAALISLGALVYKSLVGGVAYTGTPTASTVGTSQGRTGVCAAQPTYAITTNESLTFGLGPNALTSGRLMSEAKVPLEVLAGSGNGGSDDAVTSTGSSSSTSNGGNHTSYSATVTLIERNGSTVVGTQSVMVSGANCTTVTADTGQIAGGFTSLELQVTHLSGDGDGDADDAIGVTVVGTSVLSLLQLPQTITFTNTVPSGLVVNGTYTVTATGGGSGNPVVFSRDSSSTSGCVVNPSTGVVTLDGPAGTCIIDANQAGNATYSAAPQVSQTANVGLIPQTITFTNTVPSGLVVNGTYTVTATGGGSGNPVVFSRDSSSTSGCVVNPSTGVVTLDGPAGTCIVDANQAGTTSYAAALQVSQPAAIGLASQTITITSTPPSPALIGSTYQVTTTGGGGSQPVVVTIDPSSTSGCTINPSTDVVTFSAPLGTCVIDANQMGDSSYAPAQQVTQTVQEEQTVCGQQTISTASTDGTNGQVTASFTFENYEGASAPTSVCKTYSSFFASADNPIEGLTGNQTVTFGSNPLATAEMTGTITWAVQGFCTPDGSNNTTICPPTYVSFDGGQTFQPQTYCSSAQAAGIEWCTTSRSYAYTADGGTQITETWDGYGDPIFHHG